MQVDRIDKPLILQAFPHESVWIKGSQVVTGWIKEAAYWRKSNWNIKFDNNSWEAGEITAD